jgi:hypothetical protein
MQTKAARAVYKIFEENLIVSSITFHGGTNSITYPWGSNNHLAGSWNKGAEAPDHVALNSQASVLSTAAGPSFEAANGQKVTQYPYGDMTSVVYPVGGGLEDWAYGAGWDTAPEAALKQCSPKTYPLEENFFGSQDHIATAIYLIEMDDQKSPPEGSYGSRLKISEGESQFVSLWSVLDSEYNGHINRNIRTMLALVDQAKPYIQILS